MTDPDLEPAPHPESRDRQRLRALAALLAVAVVAGPMLGWSLARSTEDDRASLAARLRSAIEEDQADGDGDQADSDDGGGDLPDYLGAPLELHLQRETAEDLLLTVRTGQPTPLYRHDGSDVCRPDQLVRVGVTSAEVVGVATVDMRPGYATFAITGAPEQRPVWVVVVRTDAPEVTARFPNGTTDTSAARDGLAVLAAYADPAVEAADLRADQITIDEAGQTRQVRAAILGDADCEDAEAPPITMPPAGIPPEDEQESRNAITRAFERAYDGDAPRDPTVREEPDVWLDAQQRLEESFPEYEEYITHISVEVLEIVFVDAQRAAVRFRFVSDTPAIPAPGEAVGFAVRPTLTAGWLVSIETSCQLFSRAGVQCNL